MQVKRFSRMSLLVLVLSSLLFVYGCGSGSSGGSAGTTTGGTSTSTDTGGTSASSLTGTWSVTDTDVSDNCVGGTLGTNTYNLTVTQNGDNISVSAPGATYTGTIIGSTVTWAGSNPEDGGTTVSSSNGTVVNGKSFSGTSTWQWSDGFSSCSGSQSFTGTKL